MPIIVAVRVDAEKRLKQISNGEEKKLMTMKPRQFKEASALIKNLCCNFDRPTGGCLLLDNGDVVRCPQLQSQSVICKYFRDVLLEDREAKELKAAIMGTDNLKRCEVCGQPFRAISNRSKYCARCAEKVSKQKAAERKRKERSNVTL